MNAENHPKAISKRRWWVALLLFPLNIGYLYVGRPIRFAAYLIFSYAVIAAVFHGLWGFLSTPYGYLSFFACIIFILIAALTDIIRLSIQQRNYVPGLSNRWWVYIIGVLAFIPAGSWIDIPGAKEALAVRSFSIPSGSMAPTVRVGDYVLADMRAYDGKDPQRGDLVIFKLPRDNKIDYIKRVVGLPGDEVQMISGVVHLNGKPVMRERIQDCTGPGTICGSYQNKITVPRFTETLPNGTQYETLDCKTGADGDDTAIFIVPEGHYFMMGDNRDNSADSRFGTASGVGFVPRVNIFAQATGIFYADDFNRIGLALR